jgi:hypothetical protein
LPTFLFGAGLARGLGKLAKGIEGAFEADSFREIALA